MSYSVSGLLASRMDAMIVGGDSSPAPMAPINQGVPLGTAVGAGFKPAPTDMGSVAPVGGFSGVNEQSKRGKIMKNPVLCLILVVICLGMFSIAAAQAQKSGDKSAFERSA